MNVKVLNDAKAAQERYKNAYKAECELIQQAMVLVDKAVSFARSCNVECCRYEDSIITIECEGTQGLVFDLLDQASQIEFFAVVAARTNNTAQETEEKTRESRAATLLLKTAMDYLLGE